MILAPRIVTINRKAFALTVWAVKGLKAYKVMKSYKIAVGAIGHTTPAGLYFVDAKTRRPDWKAPKADWVQLPVVQGQIYKYGTDHNPFWGGFISLGGSEGVGIHGTSFAPEVGTRASHGCIRLSHNDILDIYDRLPRGTPVFIY